MEPRTAHFIPSFFFLSICRLPWVAVCSVDFSLPRQQNLISRLRSVCLSRGREHWPTSMKTILKRETLIVNNMSLNWPVSSLHTTKCVQLIYLQVHTVQVLCLPTVPNLPVCIYRKWEPINIPFTRTKHFFWIAQSGRWLCQSKIPIWWIYLFCLGMLVCWLSMHLRASRADWNWERVRENIAM